MLMETVFKGPRTLVAGDLMPYVGRRLGIATTVAAKQTTYRAHFGIPEEVSGGMRLVDLQTCVGPQIIDFAECPGIYLQENQTVYLEE